MKNIQYVEGRRSPWCVCFTVAGRKSRRFFKTESEAREYLRARTRKAREDGINALFFSPTDKADYEQSLTIAKEHGFDRVLSFLTSILVDSKADKHTLNAPQKAKKKAVIDAFYEYYESKEKIGRRNATLCDIRSRGLAFAKHFEGLPFADITQKQVEDWCVAGGISPRTARNNFTTILSFLRWAKRQNYHQLPLDFERRAFLPRELKKQKTVFSIVDVRDFLDLLQQEPIFRRFIPFFALQLFCGIRRAEAERIQWNYIDIKNQTIRLPAEITKTGDEHIMRAPFLPPTVFAWLAPFAPTVNKTMKIQKPTAKQRDRIIKRFGKWEHNGMRHTFATMHVSLHGDPAKTAVLLRHQNQQRLWQNYLARLVPEEDARKYFSLSPQNALLAALHKK